MLLTLLLAVGLVLWIVLWGATLPQRLRPVNLEQIYVDPHAVRRWWSVRLPGPLVGFVLFYWLVVPLVGVMGIAVAAAGTSLRDSRTKALEPAAAKAENEALQHYNAGLEAKRAELQQRAAEEKRRGQGGFFGITPSAAALEMVGSRIEREAAQDAARQAVYDGDLRYRVAQWLLKGAVNLFSLVALAFWTITLGALWLIRQWWINRSPGGFHGFARWSRWREVICAPTRRWVLPLWVNYSSTRRRWRLWERWIGQVGLAPLAPPEGDAVCSHFLLVGATGSGKGASIFGHLLASSSVPLIYQDEKSECPLSDHPRWKGALRWGCAAEGGHRSQQWNPIEECRLDPDSENAFLALAAALVPDADEGDVNGWVRELARPILAEILRSSEHSTLGELADDIRSFALVQLLEEARIPNGLLTAMGGRNVKEYVATVLYTALEPFRVGWGRKVTDAHDFKLDDLIDTGGYVLGAEVQASRRAPIRLLWTLLLRRLMRSSRPRPCTLIMDEAAKAGKIPHFAEALVTLRSRQVSIWSAWQSESLVLSVYGEKEGRAILDAFGNRVALLHGISPRDAEELSKASGTWTKKKGGHMSFGLSPQGGPSAGWHGGSSDASPVPLITATDILIRSRVPEERWAIISVRGASKEGALIIGRCVESAWS